VPPRLKTKLADNGVKLDYESMLRRAKSNENLKRDENVLEERKKHVKHAQKQTINPLDEFNRKEALSVGAIISSMYR